MRVAQENIRHMVGPNGLTKKVEVEQSFQKTICASHNWMHNLMPQHGSGWLVPVED